MRFARLMLAPVVLLTAGCLQGQRVIKVNADGSGTIVDTVKLGDQAKGMLAGLEQMDKTSTTEKKVKKDAKLKEKAVEMGVAFVSAEDTKDGGERLTWSFKDISKIKIDKSPTVSSNDAKSNDEPLTFRWAKNAAGSSVLTVVFSEKKAADKPAGVAAKPDDAQAVAMMKGMLAGLKMSSVVEVNGKLVKTNSPYVVGPTVTLLEIDFDQIDEAGLKVLAAADHSKPPSPELLKNVKGVKASSGEVTIEFTGK